MKELIFRDKIFISFFMLGMIACIVFVPTLIVAQNLVNQKKVIELAERYIQSNQNNIPFLRGAKYGEPELINDNNGNPDKWRIAIMNSGSLMGFFYTKATWLEDGALPIWFSGPGHSNRGRSLESSSVPVAVGTGQAEGLTFTESKQRTVGHENEKIKQANSQGPPPSLSESARSRKSQELETAFFESMEALQKHIAEGTTLTRAIVPVSMVFNPSEHEAIQPRNNNNKKIDRENPKLGKIMSPGWSTIKYEGFEGSFPNDWNVVVTGVDAYWDVTNYKSYLGEMSAWCAAEGSAAGPTGGPYPNGMETWMIYGPFSLANASDAELLFHHWTITELDYDYFAVFASIDGVNYYGDGFLGDWTDIPGNENGWMFYEFDLTDVYTLGNLTGQEQVWIAFTFVSDGSIGYEGTYLDEVLLQQDVPTSEPILTDHFTCSDGNNPYNTKTTTFYTTDIEAVEYTLWNSSHCTADYTATISFFDENNILYSGIDGTIEQGYTSYDFWVGIYIAGSYPKDHPGSWNAKVYMEGVHLVTDDFDIIEFGDPDILVEPTNLDIYQSVNGFNSSNQVVWDNSNSQILSSEHPMGLIIPDELKEYWSKNVPDLKYNIRALRASLDWSFNDSPIKDQQTCGSCWAFSAVALIENLSATTDLSEQTVVSCTPPEDGSANDCSIGWYGHALQYINNDGVPDESCYPYISSNGNCADKCSDPSLLVKVTTYDKYGQWGEPTSSTVSDLKALLQSGPVLVSMYVPDDNTFNGIPGYTGGIYDYDGGPIPIDRGHSVLVVGYNDDQQYFKAKNSWGPVWGESGYFRISYDDVTDDVNFGGFACTASGTTVQGSQNHFRISNNGTGNLEVTSISSDKIWLNFDPSVPPNLNIAPFESVITSCIIDWNNVPQPDQATVTINSTDPDENPVFVYVNAYPSQPPPDIEVTPPSFTFNLPQNSSTSDIMNIANVAAAGAADLNWNISEQDLTQTMSNGNSIPVIIEIASSVASSTSSRIGSNKSIHLNSMSNDGISNDKVDSDGNLIGFVSNDSKNPDNYSTAISANVLYFECSGPSEASRFESLGASVTSTTDADLITETYLNQFDVFFIGYGVVNNLSAKASIIQSYVSNGGRLIVEQPSMSGTVAIMPPGLEVYVAESSYPSPYYDLTITTEGLTHPILQGLTGTDVSGNFDTVYDYDIGSSFTILVRHSITTSAIALAVGQYGSGYVVFHTGNMSPTSMDPGSDAYVENMFNWAVNAGGDCPWIAEDPTSGTTPTQSSDNVLIEVDATGLEEGTYNCMLYVHSNDPDPDENPVEVPVTLNVTGVTFVTVDIPDDLSAPQGMEIEVPINVDDLFGLGVYSYEGVIHFDPAVLEARSPYASSEGTISSSWGPPTANSPNSSTINFGGFGTSPLEDSGTIVNLLFTVVGDPDVETDITFASFVFNTGDPAANTDDGHFTVTSNFTISGLVNYCITASPLVDATLDLSGSSSATQVTGPDGLYAFTDLPAGLDYTVIPSKTDDIGALSIGMFDASIIARAVVGIIELTPCQLKAGDVDNNGQVMMYDAACVANWVVGNPISGSQVGTWEFDPFDRSYLSLNADQINQNYDGVLLGDVDGNWIPAATDLLAKGKATVEEYPFIPDLKPVSGEILSIPLQIAEQTDLYSAYIELEYPDNMLEYQDVMLTEASSKFNLVINDVESGILKAGLYGVEAITESAVIAELQFKVKGKPGELGSVWLKEFQLNSDQLQQAQMEFKVYTEEELTLKDYALLQNYPNPFNPTTTISYNLINKEAKRVKMRIYNCSGELIRTLVDEDKKAGFYTVIWDGLNDNGNDVSSGIYYYQIKVANFMQTKKLLKLK